MIETVLDELKTIMSSDLSPKFLEVASGFGDSIVLEDISEDNIFIHEKKLIQNFPAMLVVADRTPVKYAYGLKDLNHSILIECAVTGTNEEILTRKLYRYIEAVRLVLDDNNTLNGIVMDTQIEQYNYSEMFSHPSGQFLKSFVMRILVVEQQIDTVV